MGAIAIAPVTQARADAGDFIGGAIVGGLLGHAITKDQQRKQQRTTVVRRNYSTIPSTQQGAQTQTALNYFGYNAGRVDGQIGAGSRRAIEAYQASMGYPVNGRDFQPYQYDFLMQAYYWGINGGAAQTQMAGQPLLMAYRRQVQTGSTVIAAPQPAPLPAPVTTVVVPAPTTTVVTPAPVVEASTPPAEAAPALPNLFANSQPSVSLANRCNGVMLQTSTNGGYTTLASMTDADFTLSEQFCLARSYAIARGEELMAQIHGLTPPQIAEQCGAFGDMLQKQTDAVSLGAQPQVEADMRSFAQGTGISPADLASTSRVCLAVGYSQDDMNLALGAALMLVAMGEPAYGELLGHHLREGFGANQRSDLAMQWYQASLTALDNGAKPVFMPGQTERPALLHQATMQLPGQQQGMLGGAESVQKATLPTFTVTE